ncbi:microtubule-associated protein 10 [Oxyura jamaicensis]|uniref:microtubule-associated protein 10 n=1 Tax=Oxyura jamaicensis TaxID=8884 RepID=UPI0015A65195|nr:microtubule-associated protein 10 [Oxyura jamaicensis]
MPGCGEGLYCLELLVAAVRLAAPGPALRPAVALEFLDFPPLLLLPAASSSSSPLLPGRPFPFGRGKRCLFRWRRGSLRAALRRQPLRALLVALPAEPGPRPARLLGACRLSLAPAAARLLRCPGPPASWGQRGRFPLRDAAGRPVGEVALGVRLSRLRDGGEPGPASPRAASPHASSPEEEEEEGGNIICPPVLYYRCEPAQPRPPAAAGQGERMVVHGPQEHGEAQSPPRPSAGPSLLHPQQPHASLGQLPLLSALLAELSLLTGHAAPAAVHPHLASLYQAPRSSGTDLQPPGCSPVLKPAEEAVRSCGNSRAASSPFKQGRQEATSQESAQAGRRPKKAAPQGETGSERNCKTKENRPPRRKLLYGLTNTLRLRLQQTNPDKLILLERREQYRKKQMEMLKERSPSSKRKLLRNAGEKHAAPYKHCHNGDSSKQDSQFDETVETSLQNSALKDDFSSTDVSPDLHKQAVERHLRKNETANEERARKVTAAPLLEGTVLKSAHKERELEVQLPAAVPSDAKAKGSNGDEEEIHLLHRKTTEHDDVSVVSDHKLSPSTSVEKNSELIYSDDFVVSPDNTAYSEDFTSAECTGRELEAFDSSPEPLWLESPKRPWSDTEPESIRSRVSKASQRAESTSDLLPVLSASSPVHSLKRNHKLKHSKRTSGESVDVLNDASIWAGLLDEEQEAQQINKDENRVDQHITQASIPRSKQVSTDTDRNVGNGQASAEKSQSLSQVSSYLPPDLSDLEFSVLEKSLSDKDSDFLGQLHVPNQYKDISELVINSLPGYTM